MESIVQQTEQYSAIKNRVAQMEDRSNVDFRFAYIGDIGLRILCSNKTSHIIYLSLCRNSITKNGLMLFTHADFTNLCALDLTGNNFLDIGCKYLSKAHLNQLQQLSLGVIRITSVGISHLMKAQWKILTKIDLWKNKIGVEGIKRLMKADWGKIEQINLGENSLSASQVLNLVLSENKSHNEFHLWDLEIVEGGEQKLREVLKLKFGEIQINF